MTTTSYATLGLLAIRPWTTYELAKQMAVSLHNFWPRAERKLYEEPKKLVKLGLARMTKDVVGRRPRTVYRITPKGRRALRDWLGEPSSMPTFEFEALVKVFFGEHGTRDDLVATLRSVAERAHRRLDVDAQWAAYYRDTGGRFPERAHLVALAGRLQTDLNRTLERWASWALDVASKWPEDVRSGAVSTDVLNEIANGVVYEPAEGPPSGYPD
jgi:PadR family transcriptional regulator, regulatory protein AphA